METKAGHSGQYISPASARPLNAKPEQRSELDADDDLHAAGEAGLDDDVTPEPAAAAKQRFLPSSIGVSILLPKEASELTVQVRWGDYRVEGDVWRRHPRQEEVRLPLKTSLKTPLEYNVPDNDGLRIALTVQPVGAFAAQSGLPDGNRTVSVFLVNWRAATELSETKDEALDTLHVHADQPFLARPDTRGLLSDDWDENVADLQYRDVGEYAVGHNVAARQHLRRSPELKETQGRTRPLCPRLPSRSHRRYRLAFLPACRRQHLPQPRQAPVPR